MQRFNKLKECRVRLDNTLADASDSDLLAELEHRGLVHGVKTRDLVELMWGVEHNNPRMVRAVVVRLAREHLGKIISV